MTIVKGQEIKFRYRHGSIVHTAVVTHVLPDGQIEVKLSSSYGIIQPDEVIQ